MRRDHLTDEERHLLSSGMIQVEDAPAAASPTVTHPAVGETGEVARHLEVLQSFHLDVANRFSDVLSTGLRQLADVQLCDCRTLTYSQFAFSRANPTCLVILQATPLTSPLALDFSPTAIFPMLDCLLGGGKQPCAIPERPCTELEQKLTTRIAEMLLDELHNAWEPVLAVNLTVDRIESNAQRVRLIAPSEPVITLTFRVRIAEQSGELTLCLPTRAIRKMVDKLLVGEYRGEGSKVARVHPRTNSSELVVRVVTESLSNCKWNQLKVGDILMTDVDASGTVEILIDGEVAYAGHPGAVDGRRAVELVEQKTSRHGESTVTSEQRGSGDSRSNQVA